MPFDPIHQDIYLAAFAGAMAGMSTSGWLGARTGTLHHQRRQLHRLTHVASAYAEAIDRAWDRSDRPTAFETSMVTAMAQSSFATRTPGPITPNLLRAGNWTTHALVVVSGVHSASGLVGSQGIVPPPAPTPALLPFSVTGVPAPSPPFPANTNDPFPVRLADDSSATIVAERTIFVPSNFGNASALLVVGSCTVVQDFNEEPIVDRNIRIWLETSDTADGIVPGPSQESTFPGNAFQFTYLSLGCNGLFRIRFPAGSTGENIDVRIQCEAFPDGHGLSVNPSGYGFGGFTGGASIVGIFMPNDLLEHVATAIIP